jgi:aminoglycoside phosphotransferase (APT) family kinase protein
MLGRQRDLDAVRAGLAAWLARRWPQAAHLEVGLPVAPKAGISNETFLVDARWREAGAARATTLVVRLAPSDFLVFPEYDLGRQVDLMERLAGSQVPVPRIIAHEPDPALLGTPFYVMEKIDGVIPSEVPPYHAFGFCLDASPAERAALWWAGVEALARVHAVDWRTRGLDALGAPGPGTDPLDRQLAWWRRYLDWVRGDRPQPVLTAALEWLHAHRYTPRRVTLCWGDARLPNMIFRDGRVVGVLDWEMAFLGDPEADLGWWLFLDRANSEGYGIPRLPGFPGSTETIAGYERLSGHRVEQPRWQEVFAAFRFGAIMARIADRLEAIGAPTPTPDFARDNPCTQALARLLDLPPPGRARAETRIADGVRCVQFHLTGAGARDWHVIAEHGHGRRVEGAAAAPDVTVTASAADWEALQAGHLDRAQAFLSGRLKVEGDLTLLMQLEETIARLDTR